MAQPKDTEGFWTDADGDEWYVRLLWELIDGRVECVGMELRSVRLPGDERRRGSILNQPEYEEVPGTALGPDDRNRRVPTDRLAHPLRPKALTSKLLGKLHFSEVVAETRRQHAQSLTEWAPRLDKERQKRVRELMAEWGQKKTGRPPVSPETLVAVADAARDAQTAGRDMKKAVAEALHVNETWAAKLMKRAREAKVPGMPAQKETRL